MKKIVPSFTELISIVLAIVLFSWGFWIFNGGLRPNEFGDAINPIISSITLILVGLTYRSQRKELENNSKKDEKNDFQKIFFSIIDLIRNARGRIVYNGKEKLEAIILAYEYIIGHRVSRITVHAPDGKVYEGEAAIKYEIDRVKYEIFGNELFTSYFQLIDYMYHTIEDYSVDFEKEQYVKLFEATLSTTEIKIYKAYIKESSFSGFVNPKLNQST